VTEEERATFKNCGEVIVVYARDYINDIEGEKLEDICETFLRDRVRGIILDFSRTHIINSIGISILIGIIEKVKGVGARVSFSGLKGAPYDVLRIVGLTESVVMYDTEEEALKAEATKARELAV
jgi:anti-anti-sigma factor